MSLARCRLWADLVRCAFIYGSSRWSMENTVGPWPLADFKILEVESGSARIALS